MAAWWQPRAWAGAALSQRMRARSCGCVGVDKAWKRLWRRQGSEEA
eukprot:CAMPEP_0119364396 /NCGR_PEP_ID=MMETSP1334-20130426/11324_1 /TAXON_ID=127549 /ORGANISM="Calcidiscus leptoporus, Strain RCC1130" /LENGTH=45 /DNA_ID= /DNA_START= /DNA_END= /DNA_ORIENTATION=